MPKRFPLADLIEALGDEIREAQPRAATDAKDDLFKLGTATIELAVQIENGSEAGVKFWVLELGGGVSRSDAHTLSVSLVPISEVHPGLLSRE